MGGGVESRSDNDEEERDGWSFSIVWPAELLLKRINRAKIRLARMLLLLIVEEVDFPSSSLAVVLLMSINSLCIIAALLKGRN